MKQQLNGIRFPFILLIFFQILVNGVTAKLSSEANLAASGAINRPVLSTGKSNHCTYTCNGKSFDFSSCSGLLKIECWRTYWLHGGWKLTAEIENWCEGVYTNTTAPAANDIQTRVLCDGTFATKFNVTSSFRNEPGSSIRLDYQCAIAFSSVTNKDLGRHGEPWLNFYQNTFCNGTEISELELTAPGDDSVFTQLYEMGGGFLKTDVGSCESAAHILNSVDIFGVFYSYMIIPECDPNAGISRHFQQEVLPVTINCNGVSQNATDSCSGLLLAFSQMDHGTASCKCRGDYIVSINKSDSHQHEFNCTGESYGEQMRRGGKMTFVRSSVCAGKHSFIPVHGMKSEQQFFEGSKSVCYGAAVKSTIFGPPPFENRDHGQSTNVATS